MAAYKIGVHIRPQHTTTDAMRAAWKGADALGVDSMTVWDHFNPLTGEPDGVHFESWSVLAAMACDERQIQLDHPFDLKPVEEALKQRG